MWRASRSPLPRYRIVPTVPEGQYTDAIRKALVKAVTDAVVRADGGKYEDVAPRVWVFPTEIPDGQWGSRGVIRPLPDIQAFIAGEDERQVGEERLARRRRVKALELLEGALDAVRNGRRIGLVMTILQARRNPGLRRSVRPRSLDGKGLPVDPRGGRDGRNYRGVRRDLACPAIRSSSTRRRAR